MFVLASRSPSSSRNDNSGSNPTRMVRIYPLHVTTGVTSTSHSHGSCATSLCSPVLASARSARSAGGTGGVPARSSGVSQHFGWASSRNGELSEDLDSSSSSGSSDDGHLFSDYKLTENSIAGPSIYTIDTTEFPTSKSSRIEAMTPDRALGRPGLSTSMAPVSSPTSQPSNSEPQPQPMSPELGKGTPDTSSLQEAAIASKTMAFDFVPPLPPSAPLSYSPPTDDMIVSLDLNFFEPLREAVEIISRHLENSRNDPSFLYYIAAGTHDILFNQDTGPLWSLFPSQAPSLNIILAEIQAVRTGLSAIASSPPSNALPTTPPDIVALATLDRKIDELKEETKTSLKSFAEAVKAPAPQTSPTNPVTKPKNKPPLPLPKSERLPQAIIHFEGRVDPKSRPSFTDLVPRLNSSLHSNSKFSHVKVVGVKWTQASNLVVRALAPNPSVLTSALQAVQASIAFDGLTIKDVTPNIRWSRMTLSHVYTGKETHSAMFGPSDIHEELTNNNPNYAALTIRQPPRWVRNPETFVDGQVSSISFAFEDPDGSVLRKLSGTTLTAFGNLRCTLRPWVPKRPNQETQPPPGGTRGKPPSDPPSNVSSD